MDMFYALAEPKRRQIMELLSSREELTSSEIAAKFKITNAAVSQHLKILRDSSLVLRRKQAQRRLYRINTATLAQLEAWVKQMSDRYDRLDSLLITQDKVKGNHHGH